MVKKNQFEKNEVAKNLNDIKRLLILQLLKQGTSLKEIAAALEMDPGNFSRWFPATKILSKNIKTR